MVRWPLPPRRGRPLLHEAPWRPSRPRSPPDHYISSHPHSLCEPDHPRLRARKPLALHGPCRFCSHAVLRRHDRHDCHQRLSTRLLPRRLGRSERMGHGQPELGGFHGDVRPDRVGDARRCCKGPRDPGRHHIRLDLLDGFLTVVREKDEAVARPDDVWEWEKIFVDRPRPAAGLHLDIYGDSRSRQEPYNVQNLTTPGQVFVG